MNLVVKDSVDIDIEKLKKEKDEEINTTYWQGRQDKSVLRPGKTSKSLT